MANLISYCRLALFEQQLQKGKQLSLSETNQLVESWEEVYRHPQRYIGQQDARRIGDELARGRAPVTAVLHHPQHGEGIVVSTTTTARGRELRVKSAIRQYRRARDLQ